MTDRTLSQIAYFVSPLGPGVSAMQREQEETRWLNSLDVSDIRRMLQWLRDPVPIDHQERPLPERYVDEATDRVAVFVAIASRRLGLMGIREEFERMLADPDRRYAALEGLEALADDSAVPAILATAQSGDAEDVASASMTLGGLGGKAAIAALEVLHGTWRHNEEVAQVIKASIAEAVGELDEV